jgi:YegS/Rv2252/BmrU family lipid kinase
MTKRALLLVNRHSRKGQKSLAQAVDILDDLDFELITIPIKSPEQLTQAVRDKASQIDLVIIGGGDGTLNQVVDSLVEMNLPLGILPLGTANDLARTLKLPLSIPEACKVIANGHLKYIDLGWVNGKHFFNVASIGLSVDITEKLTKGFKRRWGVLAYGLTALQTLRETRPFKATLQLGEETFRVKTIQIAVGNGRYYGGGMAIAKNATIDDQQLDIYSLELKHWWQIFPLIWTFHKGEQGRFPWVRCLIGQAVTVNTRTPQLINTDGEILTETPAEFRVIPRALGVFTKAS